MARSFSLNFIFTIAFHCPPIFLLGRPITPATRSFFGTVFRFFEPDPLDPPSSLSPHIYFVWPFPSQSSFISARIIFPNVWMVEEVRTQPSLFTSLPPVSFVVFSLKVFLKELLLPKPFAAIFAFSRMSTFVARCQLFQIKGPFGFYMALKVHFLKCLFPLFPL